MGETVLARAREADAIAIAQSCSSDPCRHSPGKWF